MNPFLFVLLVLLFVLLTPGVLLTLPKKGANIFIIALTHGIIFGIVWLLLNKSLHHINYAYIHEGATPNDPKKGESVPDMPEKIKQMMSNK